MKKRLLSGMLALLLVLSLTPAPALAASQEEILQTLAALDIMAGDERGNLDLDRMVTRAEFTKMTMAASVYRDGVGAATASPYPDVPRNHWAAGYVQAAVQAGYITGYLDGTFRPDNPITLAEGSTLVLRLLGYSRAGGDFTGAYPSAELSACHALGLDTGVSASASASLTRRDCMYLFYNLLTAQTKAGQPYLTTLGYPLTPSGEVDLVSLVGAAMEGPVMAVGSWQAQLPFDPAFAAVYRAGALSSYSAISDYDVVYWSQPMRTLWVYTTRVSGTITAVSPSPTAPTSVTVGGRTYEIETASAAYALSDLGGYRVGDSVTLLLGRTGGVAAILSGGADTSAAGPVCGVVTAVTEAAYTDASGAAYTTDALTLTATDGSTYTYPCKATSLKPGTLVQVTPSAGDVTVKRLSSASLSGRVSADGTSLGSYTFADNVEILDVYKQSAVRVYPSRLAGMTLTESMVSWYRLDARGDIDRLILSDATGDMHTYGVLTNVTEAGGEGPVLSTTGVYTYESGAGSGVIQGSKIFGVQTGPAIIRWDGDEVQRIDNLTAIKLDSASGSTAQADGRNYTLSDTVLVYERRNGSYYQTSLNLVNGGGYTLTGYYDKTERDGGRIRVILAT